MTVLLHASEENMLQRPILLNALAKGILMKITIEPVTNRQQVACLAALAKDIWNQHFPGIIGQEQVDYMLGKFQSIEALQSQMASGYEYHMALSGDEPVGYLGLIPNHPEGKLMISKIYVKDSSRGSGLGRTLLAFSKERALESDSNSIWLTVNRDNTQAIEWYKRRGFVVMDEVKKDIGSGFLMDDFIMECALG